MEHLFSTFQNTSEQEWSDRLEKDLKGIQFNDLISKDRNGIDIKPFYTIEELSNPSIVHKAPDWDIAFAITVENEIDTNAILLEELSGGVGSLKLEIIKETDWAILLKEVDLSIIQSIFYFKQQALHYIPSLIQYLNDINVGIKNGPCKIVSDPLAEYINGDVDLKAFPQLVENFSINNETLFVSASMYNNAGASAVYELACIVAHTNELLHSINEQNTISSVKNIIIELAADTTFFEQIAKLRALRILVESLTEAYNINPKLHLQVCSSDIYRSPIDVYTNLLRDSISGMAGVLGSANSLLLSPFDKHINNQSSFGRRLSRNQMHIFKSESYLNQVADIGSGSYYIESLTSEIAKKAWTDFKYIEKEGGYINSLKKGIIQKAIKQQATDLINSYKTGESVLVGVNKYPNPDDMPNKLKFNTTTKSVIPLVNIAQAILSE